MPRRAQLHPGTRRVAADVAEERLLAVVDHPDRALSAQGEHAGVDVHGQVLAPAERPADTTEREPDLLARQPQAVRDLDLVEVQPLRRDVEVDAAVEVRDGQARLRTEEGWILDAHLEVGLDHDVGPLASRIGVPVPDPNVAHQVPARVDEAVVAVEGDLGIDDRRQLLVLHDDLVERTTGYLRVVSGDDRDRFALVAHLVEGEHRLISHLHAVRLHAWDVVVGEHCGDSGHGQRVGRVEAEDASPRVRAAQRGAPQGPAQVQIGRVGEIAGDLERAVGPLRRVTDTAELAGRPVAPLGVESRRCSIVALLSYLWVQVLRASSALALEGGCRVFGMFGATNVANETKEFEAASARRLWR